jgi:hypothetical protein
MECPFLVPVIADRLWLYPVSAYCHRPDHSVRVPGPITLARVCTTLSHLRCPEYCASTARPRPGSESSIGDT